MQPLCVAGIDAGQRFLDLGLAPSGQTARFHNTQADIARLVARLRQAGVARVVLEAIGHYAQPSSRRWSRPDFRSGSSIRAASRPSARPKDAAPKPTGWTPASSRASLW